MLQLYPGFEYSTPYSNYTFSDLIDRMSDLHGDVAETLERGRSYQTSLTSLFFDIKNSLYYYIDR